MARSDREGEWESGYDWYPDELILGGTNMPAVNVITKYLDNGDNKTGMTDSQLEKRLELYFQLPMKDFKTWWKKTKSYDTGDSWNLPSRDYRHAHSTELMNRGKSTPKLEMLYEKLYDQHDAGFDHARIDEAIDTGWELEGALSGDSDAYNINEFVERARPGDYWGGPHMETAMQRGMAERMAEREMELVNEHIARSRHQELLELDSARFDAENKIDEIFKYDISDQKEENTGNIMNWLKGLVK